MPYILACLIFADGSCSKQFGINFHAMNSKFHLEFHFKMQVTIENILSRQERSWLGAHVDTSPELCTTSRGDSFSRLPLPRHHLPSHTFPNAKQPNWSEALRFSSRELNTLCCTRLCLPLSPGHYLIHPGISTMYAAKNPTEHNLGCGSTGSSSQYKVALMLKAEVRASRYSRTPALARAFVLQPRGHGMSPDQSTNLVENKFLSF